jgi:hypothetical protein
MPRPDPLPRSLRGSAFSVGQAITAGVGRERLRRADLVSPFPGVRIAASADLEFQTRCRALATRLNADTGFSGVTAARIWGVPLPREMDDDAAVHVATVLPRTRVRVRGVIGRALPAGTRLVVRNGVRVTDPETTWLALSRILSFDDLVAAGDHLVLTPRYPERDDRRPHTAASALVRAAAGWSGRDARAARLASAFVRDGAESRRETMLRLAMIRRGLPEPVLNQDVHWPDGRLIGRADMWFPAWKVIVEYDGDHHRTDARQHDRDLVRREDFIAADFTHVTVRKFGLTENANSGAARAERALRAHGWTP